MFREFEENKVCFVCTANMARSIMAESVLRKLRPDIEVFSCGILAIDGFNPTEETISVLEEKGYSCNGLVSKSVESCSFADSVTFCMTTKQKITLKSRFPKSEIYTLKTLNSIEKDITDPVKKGMEVYRETLNQIEKEIKRLFRDK